MCSLFEEAETEFGPVRALVNNAGVTGGFCRVEESLTSEVLERVFGVNVTGTILCSREAVRRMSTRNGGQGRRNRKCFFAGRHSSVRLVNGFTMRHRKARSDTFTIGLAREVATEGIRVNAVSPGLISTALHAAAGAPDRDGTDDADDSDEESGHGGRSC